MNRSMMHLSVVVLLCGSALAGAITSTALPKGKVGKPYTATVGTSGCGATITFWTPDGALPAGVEWSDGGKITGAPTRAGWYYTKAAVKGSAGSASSIFGTEITEQTPSPEGSVAAGGKQHQVTLRWDAPRPASNSYSVYRAATIGGPYRRVASGITATKWEDRVPGAVTYYYVVTSVTGGAEISARRRQKP